MKKSNNIKIFPKGTSIEIKRTGGKAIHHFQKGLKGEVIGYCDDKIVVRVGNVEQFCQKSDLKKINI